MKNLNRDTAETLKQGDLIQGLLKTEGWREAKKMLTDKIKVLESVRSIPDMPAEDLKRELKIREGAISIIEEWIGELEGKAVQHEATANAMKDEIIVRSYE